MNEHDELVYLTTLLLEAQKWSRTDTDPTGLELEVADRIKRLLTVPTDHIVGPGDPQGTKPKTVKVKDDNGKWHRVSVDKCEKIPWLKSRTGYKWILKSPLPLSDG